MNYGYYNQRIYFVHVHHCVLNLLIILPQLQHLVGCSRYL